MALRHVNAQLIAAKTTDERHQALHYNQKLWGIFLRSLQRTDCPLGGVLKQDLLTLSSWSLKHSNEALMRPLSLQPLIDVNNDMILGLSSDSIAAAEAPLKTQTAKHPSSSTLRLALTG
ncbi:flagellar biosynthesis regulator FlaF [Neokomagataea tanensis]|nr:flagellar biosynthesis regulator FlaF [Neokomagataea tanensis]